MGCRPKLANFEPIRLTSLVAWSTATTLRCALHVRRCAQPALALLEGDVAC